MLRVNTLTGFGGGGASFRPITLLTGDYGHVQVPDQSLYNFTITFPSSTEQVVMVCGTTGQDTSPGSVITSVVLDPGGGDETTLREVEGRVYGSAAGGFCYLHSAIVPAGILGGTATVRINLDSVVSQCGLSVAFLEEAQSHVETFTGNGLVANGTEQSVSNVTAEAGGATVGVTMCGAFNSTITWSLLTERSDIQNDLSRHGFATKAYAIARAATDETVTQTNSHTIIVAVASFR